MAHRNGPLKGREIPVHRSVGRVLTKMYTKAAHQMLHQLAEPYVVDIVVAVMLAIDVDTQAMVRHDRLDWVSA